MKNVSGRFCLVALSAVVLAASSAARATTFSIKAVKINPTCVGGAHAGEPCARDYHCDTSQFVHDGVCGGDITPTDDVELQQGDMIVIHVFGSDWSPGDPKERTRSFQFNLDPAGFTSGDAGELELFTNLRPCFTDPDCMDLPDAFCVGGFCDVPDPTGGAFIDSKEEGPDYIFFNLGEVKALDINLVSGIRYGATLTQIQESPPYFPPPKYCGTLALIASNDASGIFTINTVPNLPGETPGTFMLNMVDNSLLLPLAIEPLTIRLPDAPCEIVSSDPPNCAIDARQPSEPNGTAYDGWDSMTLTFNCDTSSMVAGNFTVREIPIFMVPPSITGLTSSGNDLTIHLSRRITLQKWTCIKYDPSGQEVCMGHLPADVNNDRSAVPTDILAVIDNLNGQVIPPYEKFQCDLDRSDQCAPADILRVIDLLNGADEYTVWNGQTIPACPTQ